MNIYLIGAKGEYVDSVEFLNTVGKVILLDSEEKDIAKYPELFSDLEDKIIGVAPGVIGWSFPLEVIKSIPKLRGICTKSSWGYFIDIEYCRQNNIAVCNVPGTNSRSVAEYGFWMMLTLAKNLPGQISDEFHHHLDDNHFQIEVTGKKMGILGLGRIGNNLAQMGTAFGMEISYFSRQQKDVPYKFCSVDEILIDSDFVFNCLEICPETKDYLNQDNLKQLKKSACYISVMGGAGWGIEDAQFLVDQVSTGKLAGFSIENEHKGEFPTKFIGNVFIPAGYAWYTKDAKDRTNKLFTETMVGLATDNIINEIK